MGHVTLSTSLFRVICHPYAGTWYSLPVYKIWSPYSFSLSCDMTGVHQNLNGSRDLTTPISWTVCRPWAGTCYDQSAYQIWRVYDYLNCRFEPPFGDLGVTHRVHLRWKAHCRLPISDNWIFSLSLTAAALLSEICRNQRFLKGGSRWAQILGRWGRRPQSIWTVR